MLMLAYGASVGGLLTPVGSPPNLIGRGLIEEATGERISFTQWMLVAHPDLRPDVRRAGGHPAAAQQARDQATSRASSSTSPSERAKLGQVSSVAERNTLIAFAITVTLWILPGIVALVAGTDSLGVRDGLRPAGRGHRGRARRLAALPAADLVAGSGVHADLEGRGPDRLGHDPAVRHRHHLRRAAAATGLAETIGTASADALGLASIVAITIFAVLLAIMVSETTSNTASAAVVVPIIIPIAQAAGVDPLVPALAATFAASFGFMLPVSTPQNAIVYGSGVVPITKMIRSGISFDVIGAILIIICCRSWWRSSGIGCG